MAVAIVQSVVQTGSLPLTATLGVTPTPGNMLVAVVVQEMTGAGFVTIWSGSPGSWQNNASLESAVPNGMWTAIMNYPVVGGDGTAWTFDSNQSVHPAIVKLFEVSGIQGTVAQSGGPWDTEGTQNIAGTATMTADIFVDTWSDSLVVTACAYTPNPPTTPYGSEVEQTDTAWGTGSAKQLWVGTIIGPQAAGDFLTGGVASGAVTQGVAISASFEPAPAPADAGVGLWIDWDNDGFTGTDDRTADLMSLAWNRGGTPDLTGGVQPGQATAILRNTSGDYLPDNAAGPFFGKLKPGRFMWFGANDDGTLGGSGTPVGLFAGYLRELTPIPAAGSGPDSTPTVEMIFEDPLGWYSRQKVRVSGAAGRSQQAFREQVLLAIPESRYVLASEIQTLPFSSADQQDALTLLTAINNANGTRHFVHPEAVKSDWYTYQTRNRQYNLGAAASQAFDASVVADGTTGFDGWRVTDDPVINDQQATIAPIEIPVALQEVWVYNTTVVNVSSTAPVTIIADYSNVTDFVFGPVADYTSSGSVTVTLTDFGTACKIVITSGSTGQVVGLRLLGYPVVRLPGVTVQQTDATSIADFGTRTGVTLDGPLLGVQAAAQGIVDHIVWRFAQPLRRPGLTEVNALAKTFALEMYDVVSLTVAQLSVAGILFDVVGLSGHVDRAAGTAGAPEEILYTFGYQLQESRIQTGVDPFLVLDTDVLDGPKILAY